MRNARKLAGIVAGVLAFSLIAAACGSDNNDSGSSGSTGATGGTGSLSGSITVSGSSTVLPISNLVAELFSEQNPDVQVSVDGPGTGDGFVLFCKGETDISDASRPIADDEKKACSDGGINYVELPIAFDGITVMTNPQNSAVSCLDSGDLYALFGPQSEGIDTWDGANSLAKKVGGNGGSRACRSRSRPRAPSPARTTRSSSYRGSRTSPWRKACPRTSRQRSVPTISRHRTTT